MSKEEKLEPTRKRENSAEYKNKPAFERRKDQASPSYRGLTPLERPISNSDSTGTTSSNDSNDQIDPDMRLEDQLTNAKLKQLQKIFQEADEDGGGGLDMEEFRNAMREAMGQHLTDHELDIIFMKVDTNCDGTVDWDEYLSYMLLEFKEKDTMRFSNKEKPLPPKGTLIPNIYQRHRDSIIRIEYQPNTLKDAHNLYCDADDGHGRYITVTREGIINMWSLEMTHQKCYNLGTWSLGRAGAEGSSSAATNIPPRLHGCTITADTSGAGVAQPRHHGASIWITDALLMPNVNRLALITTASDLTFYDLSANQFCACLTLVALPACPTALAYWSDPRDRSRALLLLGDVRGDITVFEFGGCKTVCVLHSAASRTQRGVISYAEVCAGGVCGLRTYQLRDVHHEYVIQLRYYATLGCFVSCSRSHDRSMVVGDVRRPRRRQPPRRTVFNVAKGVRCFHYCARHNVIASGGRDCTVRVWNPYAPAKPVVQLDGHSSTVVQVSVDARREHLISVSANNEVLVFDFNSQQLIQSIYRKWVPLGPRAVTAVCYHERRQALLLATNRLVLFERRPAEPRAGAAEPDVTSHSEPITCALYNRLFGQVVSGGVDSLVCVWDATSGERVMQFSAHRYYDENGDEVRVEITAMTFDPTLRRLITAARDGAVRIWNFNNGALLRQLRSWSNTVGSSPRSGPSSNTPSSNTPGSNTPGSGLEVTGVVCVRGRIVTGGWSRRLAVHVDHPHDRTAYRWRTAHRADVLDVAACPPGVVASASYDGDLMVWSLETGHATCRFNAYESTRPLPGTIYTRGAPADELSEGHRSARRNEPAVSFAESSETSQPPTSSPVNTLPGQGPGVNKTVAWDDKTKEESEISEAEPVAQFKRNRLKSIFCPSLMVDYDNTENSDCESEVESESGDVDDSRTLTHAHVDKSSSSLSTNINFSTTKDLKNNNTYAEPTPKPKKSTLTYKPSRRQATHDTATQRIYDSYSRQHEAAVDKLLFLTSRRVRRGTATLVAAGAGGWVRAWSVHREGGLVGQFNATERSGEAVFGMATDKANSFLITGDSQGYVKMWDITDYCIESDFHGNEAAARLSERRTALKEQFPFLKGESGERMRLAKSDQSRHRPPPAASQPQRTLRVPFLANAFRAHTRPVTSLDYADGPQRLVSASLDRTVRLWTLRGVYLGTFGQSTPFYDPPLWHSNVETHPSSAEISHDDMSHQTSKTSSVSNETLIEHKENSTETPDLSSSQTQSKHNRSRHSNEVIQAGVKSKSSDDNSEQTVTALRRRVAARAAALRQQRAQRSTCRVPDEVRRTASACTLRVLNEGRTPYWSLVRGAVLIWLPLLRHGREATEAKQAAEAKQEAERNKVEESDKVAECNKVSSRKSVLTTGVATNPSQNFNQATSARSNSKTCIKRDALDNSKANVTVSKQSISLSDKTLINSNEHVIQSRLLNSMDGLFNAAESYEVTDVASTEKRLLGRAKEVIDSRRQSTLLGKRFKSGRKHQALPALPALRHFQHQCSVYSSLPYHQLDYSNIEYRPSDSVCEILERNRCMQQQQQQQQQQPRANSSGGTDRSKQTHRRGSDNRNSTSLRMTGSEYKLHSRPSRSRQLSANTVTLNHLTSA